MSTQLDYEIIRSYRTSIAIKITADGRVRVLAPKLVPEVFIRGFVHEQHDWIEKKLQALTKHHPQGKRQYLEGEKFLYLGNWYRLQFTAATEILFHDDVLECPRVLKFRIEKELHNWYRKEAEQQIRTLVKRYATEMKTSYKSIYFSDTASKWGSCSPDDVLQFNWRLIMAPQLVVAYVVIHELAHTKHKNHSRSFWAEVERYMPSWRQQRKWLTKEGLLLHF